MKIHIIGCSGSGKTYLAEYLSKEKNIPHFDLDDIQWDNSTSGYGTKMPVEKRSALLHKILENENWIIEGVYYAWVEQCFEDADIIYLLDMPQYLYQYRIIRRFFRRKFGMEIGKKETLKSVWNLLKWTNTFQNQNMKDIKQILEKYEEKLICISSRKEMKKLYNGEDSML